MSTGLQECVSVVVAVSLALVSGGTEATKGEWGRMSDHDESSWCARHGTLLICATDRIGAAQNEIRSLSERNESLTQEITARDERIADLKTGLDTAIKDKSTLSARVDSLEKAQSIRALALRQALSRVRELDAALTKFGVHTHTCNSLMSWHEDAKCDCGLDDALRV